MGGDWKEMLSGAEKGDLELVRYYVKMGIDINYQHPEVLTTPLIESARYGHMDIVQFLLDNGADPTIKSVFGSETALSVAKAHSRRKMVKLIKSYL